VVREGDAVSETTPATVVVGCRVRIQDGRAYEWWSIVGADEADFLAWRLSEDSPLGRALVGRHAGEKCTVDAVRRRAVTIVAVETAG
jgi:transcription elongation GreA/GreB family factor